MVDMSTDIRSILIKFTFPSSSFQLVYGIGERYERDIFYDLLVCNNSDQHTEY